MLRSSSGTGISIYRAVFYLFNKISVSWQWTKRFHFIEGTKMCYYHNDWLPFWRYYRLNESIQTDQTQILAMTNTAHTKIKLLKHWISRQMFVYFESINFAFDAIWLLSFDGNLRENRMKEHRYTMRSPNSFVENPISIRTAHGWCFFFARRFLRICTAFPPLRHLNYPLLTLVNRFQCSTFVAF